MKPYRVTGEFYMGEFRSPFTIETVADSPDGAKERVLSILGSRHRVNRHRITVKDIREMKPEEVTDPVLEKRLSMVK